MVMKVSLGAEKARKAVFPGGLDWIWSLMDLMKGWEVEHLHLQLEVLPKDLFSVDCSFF
jgi:hypothetical protein